MKIIKSTITFVFSVILSIVVGLGVAYAISLKLGTNNKVLALVFNKPYKLDLVGTGSMYPTLYWDQKQGGPEDFDVALKENPDRVKPPLFEHFLFSYKTFSFEKPVIGHGDIVSFHDPATNEDYIKRVIGLPNDTLLLRDGLVIRNGQKIEEPYILKPKSTFGGETIPECKDFTVPSGKLVVMGDNRKISFDSRLGLGLIDYSLIDFDLPYTDQTTLRSHYRNISADEFQDNKVTLDSTDFLSKLNSLRKGLGINPLKIDARLTTSATARANYILDTQDYSTKSINGSNYFSTEMKKAGYDNPLTSEYFVQGYFDADDLMTLRVENKELNSLFTDKDYTDIGISVVNKDVSNCPTQITVIHLGGYIPATYDAKTAGSWSSSLKSLQVARDQTAALSKNNLYDQDLVTQILSDYDVAISIAQEINTKIQNSLWLTDLDQAKIDEYKRKVDDINTLTTKLNDEAKKKVDAIKQKNYQTCMNNWQAYVKSPNDCGKFLK